MVGLEGGVFVLVSAAATFSLSCSTSVFISLLLLLLVNLYFDGLSGESSLSHRVMNKTMGNGTECDLGAPREIFSVGGSGVNCGRTLNGRLKYDFAGLHLNLFSVNVGLVLEKLWTFG